MRDWLDGFERRIDPKVFEKEHWNDLPKLDTEEKRELLKRLHENISDKQTLINEFRHKKTAYTKDFETLAFSQMMLFWMYDVLRNGKW